MDNLGGAFRNRRLDQERRDQTGIENSLRQQMLTRQIGHETRMETKADDANKLATDRNTMQDKQRLLQTIMGLNAGGQLDDHGLSDVNDWLANDEHFSQVGLHLAKPPKKAPPQVGQNSVAQALKQAEEFRAAGNEKYATMLEQWAEKQSTDTTTETTEEKHPAVDEASHNEGGFLGIGGKKVVDSPAVPETVVKTTRKVPVKRVRVTGPDGAPGTIPEDQLDAAKKKGYKLAP